MAEIAVVHPDLETRGGAESVCMHVLETLQADHQLTLLTLNRPDIRALNRYYQTEVRPPDVRLAGRLGPLVTRLAGYRFARLQAALLGRYARDCATEFDLVFGTKNELGIEGSSIQYVLNPQFAAADPGIDRTNAVRQAYNRVCQQIVGVSERTLRSATYLATSDWTADALEDTYSVRAETIYPPVDVSAFPGQPWDDREAGFVTIGRIGPSKRILRNVEIVTHLRQRGHDVHLHVAGPTTDGEYAEHVERVAAEKSFVSIEGSLSREELIDLIVTHKYGLHGRPYEHFGIAVAELVAGGTIPFAPDSGGQREILGGDSRLLYDSAEDAVETIDAVLSDRNTRYDLRASLDDAASAFGRDRFAEEIRAVVGRELAKPEPVGVSQPNR
jgi:glycosyltransferase involved in cell wall biosynthesis